MHIEYLAAASWPLDSTKRTTRVEVTMEGSYDILHDISCTQRKPITSPYRTSVIRRFWNTLQRSRTRDSSNASTVLYTTLRFIKERIAACYCPITWLKYHVCSFSINQTDQMLVHLQSFNSLPENYMIPESTKNGVPLFYIPPGSTTPVLLLLTTWKALCLKQCVNNKTLVFSCVVAGEMNEKFICILVDTLS